MDKDFFQLKTDIILEDLRPFQMQGATMFVTSSFQRQSLPLLHILATNKVVSDVYMTDTRFLFPETLSFADEVCERYSLNLIKLRSSVPLSQQRCSNGDFWYVSDPDYCCDLNKVQPLKTLLESKDLWINGVRRDQSASRARLNRYSSTIGRCIRYHPMLDWTAKDIHYYSKIFKLPAHPLEVSGYDSVGCEPCTVPLGIGGNSRNARWLGMNKTECGLNTDLIARAK